MSPRPTPRKSSLAGSSPVAPPVEPAPAPSTAVHADVEQPPVTPVAAPQRAAEPTRRTTQTAPGAKYPHKVSFYQDPEDTARVRGAILHTMTTEGSRTLSQFIHHAVMVEVERLEAKYNGGQPFPSMGARELPQGRPMGQ